MRPEELDEILERSLKADPGYLLSADFAKNVTANLERKEQWKSDLMDYFYLVACLLLLLAAVTGIYYFANNQLFIKALVFLKSNYLPVVYIVTIFNFILLADRVLLRLLFSRWKS